MTSNSSPPSTSLDAERPWQTRSGWCVTGNHGGCSGYCAGVACTCACHDADAAPAQPTWAPQSVWCATARHADCKATTLAAGCGCRCHDDSRRLRQSSAVVTAGGRS